MDTLMSCAPLPSSIETLVRLEVDNTSEMVLSTVKKRYELFLPGMKAALRSHAVLRSAEKAALFYAEHAVLAMELGRSFHLSRKRDKAPLSAEISAQGECFLCLKKPPLFVDDRNPCLKKVKQAFDLINRQLVARSVEVYGWYTQKHRQAEETARADLADAPWMVKEYFHGTYFNGRTTKWVTIREKMQENLFDWVQTKISPSQEQKNLFIHQLLQQMVDIHKKGIHKDLKLGNVLVALDEKSLSTFDFDFYKRWEDRIGRAVGKIGTCSMNPPEFAAKMMRKDGHKADFSDVHTAAYDIWGLGLMLAELQYGPVKGEAPWTWVHEKWIWRAIHRSQWLPAKDSKEPIATLIHSMLERDPTKRPSAQQALEFFRTHVLRSKSATSEESPSPEGEDFDGCTSSRKLDWPELFEVKESGNLLDRSSTD